MPTDRLDAAGRRITPQQTPTWRASDGRPMEQEGAAMKYAELAARTDLHPGAMAAWRARFDSEPKEPLDTRGGPLDPGGWCMQLAAAVADDTEIPGVASNAPTPHYVVEAVAAALHGEGQ